MSTTKARARNSIGRKHDLVEMLGSAAWRGTAAGRLVVELKSRQRAGCKGANFTPLMPQTLSEPIVVSVNKMHDPRCAISATKTPRHARAATGSAPRTPRAHCDTHHLPELDVIKTSLSPAGHHFGSMLHWATV